MYRHIGPYFCKNGLSSQVSQWSLVTGFTVAQLLKHETGNPKGAGSSPAFGISRYGSSVHPAVKWVPDRQGWHHGCLPCVCVNNGRGYNALQRVETAGMYMSSRYTITKNTCYLFEFL